MKLLRPPLATLLFLALVSPLPAQWRTTSYALKAGWSSMYINGDATWQTPDQHLASMPEVLEIWRWNSNPDQTQFSASPSQPNPGTREWSVWRRGQPEYSDLSLLSGQTAYLVKLQDGAPDRSLSLKQRVEPPRVQWLRQGSNFLGFPTRATGSAYPAFSSYFGLFPAATASKIYRYNGGPLDTNNPVRVFSPGSERLDATQAYWFEARSVSDFAGPLHFEISDPTGLNFGQSGSLITVSVRNRTAAQQILTFAPMASEAAPPGQPVISGPVALTRRNYNTATQQYEDTPITASFTATVPANGTTQITFGVDRPSMAGPSGSFFASLLRITDAANMMDVHLPVTAGSSSLAGLWIGDAELTDVESKTPGYSGTATAKPFPLRYLIHMDDTGRATLLSQVFIGTLAANPDIRGFTSKESDLKQDELASAMRLSAAHLPLDRTIPAAGNLAAGGTLAAEVSLAFNDPTNPFVHQYHPDHDNRDARLNLVQQGVESWTVKRAITFNFANSAPAGLSAGWGSRLLAGTYSERFSGVAHPTEGETGGIYRKPITASGTFVLRRVSETPVIVSGPAYVDPYITYTNNFTNGPEGALLRGAAVLENQAVLLTDAVFGQVGAVVLNQPVTLSTFSGFTAKFTLNMGPAGNTIPADGVSFAVGNLGSQPWGESGPGTAGSLAVGFDTYNNGGTGDTGVHIWVNGEHVLSDPFNPFTDGQTVPVEVIYSASAGITVKLNNTLVFNNAQLPAFRFPVDGRFGFGARTGGAVQRTIVDDVVITPR